MTRAVLLVSILLVATDGVSADQTRADLPARVTLDQALQMLNDRSPRTLAERASVDVVAADRLTANTWPNPSVTYGGLHLVSGLSTGAVTQHQFVVDQPLPILGQRQSRRALADLSVSAERARVDASLAERQLEVRQAFASLMARQEESRILQESRAELERIEHVVRGRAEAGDRSEYDVLRIDTERRMLDVEVTNAATDVEDASGHLASLLGFAGWRPRADGTLEPGPTSTDVDVLWETAQQRRPALRAARERQSVANGGLLVARRERRPTPTVSGGALFTREVQGTSSFFGVSLPIPLFDRNRGAIARASAEVDEQKRTVDAEMAEARAEIERARSTFDSRRQTLSGIERDLMQRVPLLRRMAEDAYREGRDGILELIDASRSLKDIQLLHVKQLETTKLAEEDLRAAAGLDAAP